MLERLFHPPADLSRERYLRFAVATVTLLSLAASVGATLLVELFNPQADYLRGLAVALAVPVLVVPPLAYWHHKVLYDLEAAKRTIEKLSRTDGLTGLHNRRHFFALAEQALALARRHGQPAALLILDLDHFKAVNDRHGHQTGDQVLARAARIMQGAVRQADVLARYGGEEFVLLAPHAGAEEARQICRRLRRALERGQAAEGGPARVTVSIGAALAERAGWDLEALLARADQALYQAKEAGRDTFVLAEGDAPARE
jgi:diguanylate cyclase (GGDEF)-like protein